MEFSGNYSDLSSNKGFQFEFNCDKCGKTIRTKFKPSATGAVTSILETASSIFGGVLGTAADVSEKVRSASWAKSHDNAFEEAIKELAPSFKQCPKCSSWFCMSCWNSKRGLCKNCAPDLGVEMSAAQASRSVEEVWAHAKMAEEDKKLAEGNWRETIVASCPKCSAPLQKNAAFCPECGEKLRKKKFCGSCGAEMDLGNKFCPSCGEKSES